MFTSAMCGRTCAYEWNDMFETKNAKRNFGWTR